MGLLLLVWSLLCGAGFHIAGLLALLCGLFPLGFYIPTAMESSAKAKARAEEWLTHSGLPFVGDLGGRRAYAVYWIQGSFLLGAAAVALKVSCRAAMHSRKEEARSVRAAMQSPSAAAAMLLPWLRHRCRALLHRASPLPCWLVKLGAPAVLCPLDVLVFSAFLAINWCVVAIRVKDKLRRGERGCEFVRPKTAEASEGRAELFTMVGLESMAQMTGVAAILMMGWYCILPVSRRSVFLEMLGMPWETAIKYHNWMGFQTTFMSLLHTFGYVAVWILASNRDERNPSGNLLKQNLLPWGCSITTCSDDQQRYLAADMWGFGAMILMAAMAAFALPFFRRRFYELFYVVHLLWMPMLIMVQLHDGGAIYSLGPGLACHCVDKALAALAQFGACRGSLKRISSEVAEVVVANSLAHIIRPGQYVLLNVPELSTLQWHPFSVTWASDDGFALHVKAGGDWSRALYNLAGSKEEVRVKVNGAYGKDVAEDAASKDALLLWAGGVGLTYVFSVAEEACRSGKRVYLRWVVRTREEERAFAALLEGLPGLDLKVWVTRPEAGDGESRFRPAVAKVPEEAAGAYGVRRPAAPMSSLVPRAAHALICAAAIFMGMAGFAFATAQANRHEDAYAFPKMWHWTRFTMIFYPFLFAFGTSVLATMVVGPVAFAVQQHLRARRALGVRSPELFATERCEALFATERCHATEVLGSRPCMAEDFDDIAEELGAAADIGVFVAGPDGLVRAVEAECAKRAWDAHCWHVEAEPWQW